jgi:CRP/FNR family transcriptional regulator, cyclic AMP receptor protein
MGSPSVAVTATMAAAGGELRKALYILGQLTDLDVEWLVKEGHRTPVRRGDVIIRQRVPVESLYIVLSGEFSVTDERMGGAELARLGSGEIVGEMSFIDAAPPSATVRAEAEGLVLALRRDALQRKLEGDTAFAARFYRALAIFLSDRLRATVGRLGYGDVKQGLDEEVMQEDELDLKVLGNIHLAGARFDTIIKRMSTG